MKKLWETIKKTLLYCGLNKDTYNRVKYRVSEDNRKTISTFTLLTALAFVVVLFINIAKKNIVSNIIYVVVIACFMVMWILSITVAKKHFIVGDALSIFYAILLLTAGVFIGINQSNERTTLLLPFFVYASTIFSFRIIYLAIMMIGFESIYLYLAFQSQAGNILTVNVTNTIIFSAIGLFVGGILMKNKYKKFEADDNNQYLSEMDSLTDIPNRRSYDNYIEYLKNNIRGHKVGIIIFDIDYFKKYNDYYGHAKGDEVLINIVKPIKEYIKQYADCKLFRYGGEEFVVVVDKVDERIFKDIAIDINRLIYQLDISRDDIKEFSRITVSVGAALEVVPNISGDYITNADNQLYLGKNIGRNSVYYDNKSLLTNVNIDNLEDSASGNYIMNQVLNYLCHDYNDIYSVDCQTKRVTVYRSGGKVLGIARVLKNDFDYESSFKAYIENNIHPLDKEKVYKKIEFDSVYEAVKQYGVVSIYYRVLRDDKMSFYKIKFMPMGSKENFTSMICAFLPEDIEVGVEQKTQIAELDELTNVYTRQAFYHYAKTCIDEKLDTCFYIVASDIENFRFLNNIYGTAKCDTLLNYFARLFGDYPSCHVIGRYGNDQFVMLLEGNEVFDIENYRQFIVDVKQKAPVPYVSVKFGICKVNNIDEPINAVCDKAFLALKDIKHQEDVPVCIYNDELVNRQSRIQMLESDFERAFNNNGFVIYCQPKFNVKDKTLCGGEALIRWKHENGEMIMPGEFIPIFEKIGVISRIDEYVYSYVCKKQKELLDKGITPLPVSVNISRNTLFLPTMVERYKDIIESYGIDKKLVPLEITESFAIGNYDIRGAVQKLKENGFVIHLDDFGTGYSSLSSLSILSIDAIKIDKELISRIGDDKGEELLKLTIDLAHYLKTEIIAEGVQSEEQYIFLKHLNCEIIQGYYFSKSMEYDKYEDMLK